MAMEGMSPGGEGHQGDAAKPAPKAAQEKPAGKTIYYCPMHPTYTSDRPGDCPICNMTLVPLAEAAAEKSAVEGHAIVTVSPVRRQLIGVVTEEVQKKEVLKTIRAVGRVEYNEKSLSAVNLKFSGWIEELLVKSTGERVAKGDPLFVIYSPELLEAEQNYLLALGALHALGNSKPNGDSKPNSAQSMAGENLRSARERLLLLDLTAGQIKELEDRKEAPTRLPIFSKVGGVVIRRNVLEGSQVQAGMNLYELADLSTVWVTADIYEYEVPLVKVGQDVKMSLPSLPGEELPGKVTYVYPYLNEATRTVRVRVELSNPEWRLKPGMYGDATIEVPLGEQVVVTDQAILDSGVRQIVFVDLGEGRMEPREVKVGHRTDGLATILDGLSPGEKVVKSGNFLIDSESRLKAALLQGASGGMHKH
jgi:Cu(I)/Ag(I) efflux system membrane fusion protein